MNSKPTKLNIFMEQDLLLGTNPENNVTYKISWCGNGQYSHYSLSELDNPARGWYVYVDQKDELYKSIYDAEMFLVYKVRS